jgi:hypothetical protein
MKGDAAAAHVAFNVARAQQGGSGSHTA